MPIQDISTKKKICYNKMGKQKKSTNPSTPSSSSTSSDVSSMNKKSVESSIIKLLDDLTQSIKFVKNDMDNIKLQLKEIDGKQNQQGSSYRKMNRDLLNLNDKVEENYDELTDHFSHITDIIEKSIVEDEDEDEDEDYDVDEVEHNNNNGNNLISLEAYAKKILKSNVSSGTITKEEMKIRITLFEEYVSTFNKKEDIQCSMIDYFINLNVEQMTQLIASEKNIQQISACDNLPIRYKIQNLALPDYIKRKVLTIVENCSNSKTNTWIKGLFEVPWGAYQTLSVSNTSSSSNEIAHFLSNARNVMNNVAYGQNNAKEHILEVISKMIINPNKSGNVFGVHGAMGTGKTTLIKNGMAKALGLPFMFISLGGMQDSSHLVGHDFTYEGSTPGRIVEGLKSVKCMNPIIFFDELDKVSETSRGNEINNMLIHMTDSSQNVHFQDKYYSEIPIDLSKATFVFSLNHIDKINPILRDRMHMIKLDKFNGDEKLTIAKDYILPELYSEYNITVDEVIFKDDILRHIISKTVEKEDGVRGIKRRIETILSKLNVIKLLLTENDNNNNTIDNQQEIEIEHINKKRKITRNNKKDNAIDDKVKSKKSKNKKPTKNKEPVKQIDLVIEKHNILQCVDIREISFPIDVDITLVSKLLNKIVDNDDFPYYMYS